MKKLLKPPNWSKFHATNTNAGKKTEMASQLDKNEEDRIANRMILQQSNSLLNEHWKRKQRLKQSIRPHVQNDAKQFARAQLLAENSGGDDDPKTLIPNMPWLATSGDRDRCRRKTSMIDETSRSSGSTFAVGDENGATATLAIHSTGGRATDHDRLANCCWLNLNSNSNPNSKPSTDANMLNDNVFGEHSSHGHHHRHMALNQIAPPTEVTALNGAIKKKRKKVPTLSQGGIIINFTSMATKQLLLLPISLLLLLFVSTQLIMPFTFCNGQSMLQSDPRPTIYSGQVSFGLLLSAHSSLGAELSTSASHQVVSMLQVVDPPLVPHRTASDSARETTATTTIGNMRTTTTSPETENSNATTTSATTTAQTLVKQPPQRTGNGSLTDSMATTTTTTEPSVSFVLEPQFQLTSDSILEELIEGQESRIDSLWNGDKHHSIERRQIFERTGQHRRQNMFSQPLASSSSSFGSGSTMNHHQSKVGGSTALATGGGGGGSNQLESPGICSVVNANALYAGMGAIWASHQANLVGDSHLAIGTYVYDSCNDLDVGQRQSVRIVSNLNAFQQTTCESPRGSPISLTIAHGDNQLRAIQLLTSFKVPVITTKEHFDLEDYNQLTRDQKRFLFTTASSSRHLAVGALRFSKRIVSRSVQSPKLPNQFYKMSSKNGLIVISRNLPARFIAYLTEMIPNHVNYEMLQSNQPIDQIRSVEALESILIKSSPASSESKVVLSKAKAPLVASNRNLKSQGGKPKRSRRNSDSSSDPDSSMGNADGSLNGDFDSPSSSDDPDNTKMLSPTILMFITPSEAIDLVTRLRNDLAEVSRYYSLIVTTREDISPALKTIFHRGGSRLCSGKAFYTISPKPDDIGEFSRYFRDTVQMEGESSDHPLVCEFAKYQATSKVNADLDDISTEPVIKAVWSAAAAFKSVHRRECGSLAAGASSASPAEASGATGGGTSSASASTSGAAGATTPARTMSSRQSSKSAHADCLVKMNKNMSNLVQRALRRLDVTINSTGLQSLDGFRLKFDDLNELMTNKFSIKYINKECEITEIGQYSGHKDSSLRIDEETLVKSLEGSMPDPWPAPTMKPAIQLPSLQQVPTQTLTTLKPTSSEPSTQGSDVSETTGYDSGDNNQPAAATTVRRSQRRKGKRGGSASETTLEELTKPSVSEQPEAEAEVEDSSPALAGDSSDFSPIDPPRRNRKRSKPGGGDDERIPASQGVSKQRKDSAAKKKQLVAAPVTALGGRNILPGLTDTELSSSSGDPRSTRAISASTTTSSIITPSTLKPMRKLKPFPSPVGTTIKDWLPIGEPLTTAPTTKLDTIQTTTRTPFRSNKSKKTKKKQMVVDGKDVQPAKDDQSSNNDDEDEDDEELLKAWPTTQAPIYSTLPESDGNANLELPAKQATPAGSRVPKSAPGSGPFKLGRALQAAASTSRENSADYVTSPSISKNLYNQVQSSGRQPYQLPYQTMDHQQTIRSPLNLTNHGAASAAAADGDLPIVDGNRDYLKDLNTSPIPLSSTSRLPPPPSQADHYHHLDQHDQSLSPDGQQQSSEPKAGRLDSSRLRSHMRWIYSSWYALTILGANVCGALLTLYVLTFLLMRNCDGSLDRDNQGIRSMHLLAIIVVFFGSTLFIVYPTPGLCLLRTSWHNFALVMLFGSLLLQAMQTRSLGSLGLGGRPNRLNQFLTLIFMVGVQVAFELQRWKYESSNYLNFVNQYFGNSHHHLATGDKKFLAPNDAISSSRKFNILNSFNDQVTPISIQISEHYQNLLQDYCQLQVNDFLQSQIYLCLIVGLLVMFSASNRRRRRLNGPSSPSTNHHHKHLKSTLTSGKLVASQHEANLNLSPSHFQFASQTASSTTGNMFVVTIISALTYTMSIVLHIYGQNIANRDLISSVTMVLIAFTALIGIFLPILLQIHCYDGLLTSTTATTTNLSSGTLTHPVMSQSKLHHHSHTLTSSSSPTNAFTMFPEFAPTGLRRPASISGDSSSGAGSRRTFADTRESRRNMGAALANLGPSADSLRSMGFYTTDRKMVDTKMAMDPSSLNLKLNLSAIDEPECSSLGDRDDDTNQHHYSQHQHHHHPHPHQNHSTSSREQAKGEKRLIMLDVDPCCPRHGVGAWTKIDDHHHHHHHGSSQAATCKGGKTCKSSHCNQQ